MLVPIGIPILTLPKNEVSEADVDVVDTKVNSEAKFPTGEVRVASIRLPIMIIRPESMKIISGDEALSSLSGVFIAGQHVTPGTVNSLKDGHLWDQH